MARQEVNILIFNFKPERKNSIYLNASHGQISSHFIIDVLKTKLVRARMDQAGRKVLISSTMHRTFGKPQWMQLRDLLAAWKANLTAVQEGMKSVAAAQMELAGKNKTSINY